MIQAPSQQYIPVQQPILQNYQQQGANIGQYPQQQMDYQAPATFYNYPQTSCYAPTPKSQYNGVNIEILNPQGQGMVPMAPAQQQVPAQFVPVQPLPVMVPPTSQAVVNPPQVAQQPVAPQPAAQQPVAQQPVPEPQPQITPEQAPAAAPQGQTPVVEPAVAPDAAKTAESFAGRLKTDNIQDQQKVIEEIALAVRDDDVVGNALLDTQVFDALVDIINKDTSALQGPTPDVIELRNKPVEELTPDEKAKAETPSPLEAAEMNKQHSLYTISFMQNRLNNELVKLNGQALDLKDLPCIETVIDCAKSNPDPRVRISALAALSHISRPEYKEDLTKIFELAKSDENVDVQQSAQSAIDAINQPEVALKSTTA